MASPATGDAPNGVATPPNPTQLGGPSPPTTQTSGTLQDSNGIVSTSGALPSEPAISTKIDEMSHKRPRDARLIHLVLAAQGVQAYQERVPLMLMDFAYRYTSSILGDAFQFSNDGYYRTAPGARGAAKNNNNNDEPSITLDHLRLAMAARSNYQFQPSLPKDYLLSLAAEKNKVALPKMERVFGLRLPGEAHVLSAGAYGLKEEWDEEEEVGTDGDEAMGGIEGGTADQEEIDQAEFEEAMGTGGGGGGDTEMSG